MPGSIDWMYHRKSCVSCQRARTFLEENEVKVKEAVDATKDRRGRDEALAIGKAASKVIVARGKKVVTFDMKKDPPDDETLVKHILGPSGNLRAPTLRKGNTLYVGFNEETYQQFVR